MAYLVEHTLLPFESRVVDGRPVRCYTNALGIGLIVMQGHAFTGHRMKYFAEPITAMIPDLVEFLEIVSPQGSETQFVVYGVRTDETPWKA